MTNNSIIESISSRLVNLSRLQLSEVEQRVKELEFLNAGPSPTLCQKLCDWPHAPVHRLDDHGVFLVTAGTMHKAHFFDDKYKLDMLQSTMLQVAAESQWQLEAWACFPNHYHFIARAEKALLGLDALVDKLHSATAMGLNQSDGLANRKVWFNYFDTKLTFHNSYMARLNYVHQNPVRHRLVKVANQYPWCSAAWFERTATPAQIRTVYSFKTDNIHVQDDFDEWPDGHGVL